MSRVRYLPGVCVARHGAHQANYQGVRPTQPWSSVASPKKAEQSSLEAEQGDVVVEVR